MSERERVEAKLNALVLFVGVALLSAGAAFVYWPAGLMVAGVLLVLVAWPERGGDV